MGTIEVKVCGMRVPENVQTVVQMKPEYMGFIFAKQSPRFLKPEDRERVLGAIPPEVLKVGVFVDENAANLTTIAKTYNLQVVQLHGDETPFYCEQIRRALPDIKIWKALPVTKSLPLTQIRQFEKTVDRFVLDTAGKSRGGTGEQFDWSCLKEYNSQVPFVLAGGIGPYEAPKVKEGAKLAPQLVCADINSRFEREPGMKNTSLVQRFISEIRK